MGHRNTRKETETSECNLTKPVNAERQIEELRNGPMAAVREKYRELFGEEPRSKHKESLMRRIGWRLQAAAEGGLSQRARERALQIASEADLRVLPPRGVRANECHPGRGRVDPRIPPPGAALRRLFRGRTVEVKVLAGAFEYEGRRYGSLSAIATEVTGTRWNGLTFFGLSGEREKETGVRHAARKH